MTAAVFLGPQVHIRELPNLQLIMPLEVPLLVTVYATRRVEGVGGHVISYVTSPLLVHDVEGVHKHTVTAATGGRPPADSAGQSRRGAFHLADQSNSY